jgi:hypothetical protein
MRVEELWVESYQGEVLGERLFGLLAERQQNAPRRSQLEALALLERATKELAEPVFERRALDRGDTTSTIAKAKESADALGDLMPGLNEGVDAAWRQFLGSFEPVISQFLAKYRELVELAADGEELAVAQAYCEHELALAAFARRALGEEVGEPLGEIFALPHVKAARAAVQGS